MPAPLSARRGLRLALAVVAMALGSLGGGHAARADGITAAECVASNEQAGPLRRAGKLREARAKLRACSVQKCPAIVRKDCVASAAQADADMPTLAFSVHDAGGNDLAAVRVTVDGATFAEKLDGTALEVDPGEHVFAFESAGQPRVERRLVIVEGEKNRHERLQMGEPPAPVVPIVVAPPPVAPAAPPPSPGNPRRTAGLAIGGAGAGLLAVGGVFGLFAVTKWSAAKQACGPTFPVSCSDQAAASSNRSSSVVAGVAADVTLVVGAAALVTGAVLILTLPTSRASTAAGRLTVRPAVGAGTGTVVLGGAF